MTLHVLINGAGVAGLTAALALLQRGADVTLTDQAGALTELGAGVQISPNGARVLQALGIDLGGVACLAAAKEVRLWDSGQRWPLFDLGEDCRTRFGAPYWLVHRGDLQRSLLRAVLALKPQVLRLGLRGVGFADSADHIALNTEGGEAIEADVLLAADGVHSALRRAVFTGLASEQAAFTGHAAEQAAFTGLMAWRGVVPTSGLPASLQAPVGVNWVGPGGHVVTYPLRRGELLNFVGIVERSDWRAEGWNDAGSRAECARDFAGWHADIHRIIAAIDVPYRWALLSRPPLTRWSSGRLCLLGDAAHPMLPMLAQGANMALEDGLLVARCLTEIDEPVPAALQRFERLRLPRANRAVQGSADNAKRFHNPVLADPAAAAEYMAREWAPERVRQRYDWVFEHDVNTQALD